MKRTPLYNDHIKLKGKMVEFGGWEMPVLYSGVIDEHNTVRTSAGLFDVSHMGEFDFSGPDALECVQYLTTNDASKLADGQAVYSLLPNDRGGLVDDVIVYRFNSQHLMLVVNAANIDKDWAWVMSHKKGNVTVTNKSDNFGLIALQGPKAAEILRPLTDINLDTLKLFHFASGKVAGKPNCIVARTGYTGEDGFEIFSGPSDASDIWSSLIETGRPRGLKPIGLGARDTLRLEMRYSLYGHEINDETNPFEAGLSWVVKMDKPGDFMSKEIFEKIKAEGPKRKCVGFRMVDQGIPREGYKIFTHDAQRNTHDEIGRVCSGTMSPSLQKAIGTGYVPVAVSQIGSKILIDIRGNKRLAEIVDTPFYKKR
ncbi:MAG: glycine cleavage system protein T [Deltaproteobacteria bacterium CG11_big_fil_rev_8_21_14_0_20_49_13]|nr:MAG: glycine cleavage system protein T [Deltaproteobacteria bacterium CG11_big_fil_rev_8_21_14_0_20_49_13]